MDRGWGLLMSSSEESLYVSKKLTLSQLFRVCVRVDFHKSVTSD